MSDTQFVDVLRAIVNTNTNEDKNMTTKKETKIETKKAPVKKAESIKAAPVQKVVKEKKEKKRKEMVVSEEMKKVIIDAKQMVKDGMNKAEVAREVFDMLKNHERRQVIHVFMEGAGLTKAGSSTYYFNIQQKVKAKANK